MSSTENSGNETNSALGKKLKIAHIVTLVSPDAAYGGPLRVALNQCTALRNLGHEVTIFAGQRGFDDVPQEITGIPLDLHTVRNLFPKSAFAGTWSSSLLKALWRALPEFDVVHLHLARDLVTLPAARLVMSRGTRFVAQPHGMITASGRALAIPIDAALTKRALRRASRVFYLTDTERSDLEAVAGPGLSLAALRNGVPIAVPASPEPSVQEVLFLARLHPRKRPQLFVKAAIVLAGYYPNARFTLVGPDEGEGEAVTRLIESSGFSDRISWEGPIAPELTLARMRQATVFALPSIDEPFGMSVLEAMSIQLPVIVTDTCGLAPDIAAANAGIVIDESQEALVAAMGSMLQDDLKRRELGTNALQLARISFSMEAVARELVDAYTAPQ